MNGQIVLTATIANGESLSNALRVDGAEIVGIVMPAAWTTADLTFQASADGTTYNNLYNAAGTEVTVKASTDRYIAIEPAGYIAFKYLKVRSGTGASAVAQGAARSIGVIVKDL